MKTVLLRTILSMLSNKGILLITSTFLWEKYKAKVYSVEYVRNWENPKTEFPFWVLC